MHCIVFAIIFATHPLCKDRVELNSLREKVIYSVLYALGS